MQLYQDTYPKIRKYICRNSGIENDALDIFQDSVIILCKQVKLKKFDLSQDVDAFLFTVGRNLWINKAKKQKKISYISEDLEQAEYHDFSDDIITYQKEKAINKMMKDLGEKCYELLRYSIFYRTPNKEICELMGFATENSVKTQKYKCKKKLFKLLEQNPTYREVFD